MLQYYSSFIFKTFFIFVKLKCKKDILFQYNKKKCTMARKLSLSYYTTNYVKCFFYNSYYIGNIIWNLI